MTSYSWGSNKDANGTAIDAAAAALRLPTSATDADIALVAQQCKQLESLDLTGCVNISDDGITPLCRMHQLQTLVIVDCNKITDAGLHHLAKLPLLRVVEE